MIIGIAGHIGAGKDTIANYFIREHGFMRVGFADALKEEVLARLPKTLEAIGELAYPEMSRASIGAYLLRTKPPVIRALLQEWGTELRRADDPDYWVDRWEERRSVVGSVVAPDVRFENEARHIKNVGGHVLHVIRPGNILHVIRPGDYDHASEKLEWPWDWTFVNNGTVEDLELVARAWWEDQRHEV